MKVSDRVKKFVNFASENLENNINYENEEILEPKEQQTQKVEKKTRIQKITNKTNSILEKIELLEEQLKSQELTPFKRFKIQIKLSILESKLDKQMAYMDIENFKKDCEKRKENISKSYNQQLEKINQEYEEMFDKEYELQRDIELLSNNIKERKITYSEINSNNQNANSYKYKMLPKVQTDLENKQKELEELADQKQAKYEEIKKIQEELMEEHTRIDEMKSKKLIKFNPIAINLNMFKAFCSRVKNNIVEWFKIGNLERKVSKQAVKEAAKKAKIESKEEVRKKIAEIKEKEIQTKYNRVQENRDLAVDLSNDTEKDQTESIVEKNDAKIEETEKTEENSPELEEHNELSGEKYMQSLDDKLDKALEETNIENAILNMYIEESKKEDFDKHEFIGRIRNGFEEFSMEEKQMAMRKIDSYRKKQKAQKLCEGKEEASEHLKEKQDKCKGKKWVYENGNYVLREDEMQEAKEQNETEVIEKPVVQEEQIVEKPTIEKKVEKKETLTQREKFLQENAMDPILKMYIEEVHKEGFNRNIFIHQISHSGEFTEEEQLKGMRLMDNYDKEQRENQEYKGQEENQEQEEIDR